MKRITLVLLIIIFLNSCGYTKDEQIYTPIMSNESYYMVRVFNHGLTSSGALIIYKLPMEGITDKKVDSVNKLADQYIKNCEKYAN